MLRPIPTPKWLEPGGAKRAFTQDTPLRVHLDTADEFAFAYLSKALLSEHGLSAKPAQSPDRADILITEQQAPYLSSADLERLSKQRYAARQGYVIRCVPGGPVVLYGQNRAGRLNAISTLLELLQGADGGATLNEATVVDSPDFLYRGNCYLLYAETSGWSYDFGDGEQRFLERMERKLDLCLRHKVNMVLADGLDWSTEKTPRYKHILRAVNRMAREREIHIVSAGYGAGYGASAPGNGNLFQGIAHKNLDANGEPYGCLRSFGRDMITGSCLSNEALCAAKERELVDFVRTVEPGALYLHHTDEYDIFDAGWAHRCDACREAWPNDDLFAADGMAGAYAHFYSRVARALQQVKTDSGYDASRDLLLMFVSPGYGWYFMSDARWRDTVRYWAKVGELMDVDNAFLTLREQYYDNETVPHGVRTERRFDQLRAAFDAQCPGAGTADIYFGGSDGYYSDRLFNTVPLLHYTQLGVDILLNADGNAFQEPLQLLNAEYMWNSQNSAFYNLDEAERPRNYYEALALMKRAGLGLHRPEPIFGADGFLHEACRKLYGELGTTMEQVFRLCGENGEQPAAYMRNVDLGTPIFFNPPATAWHNELSAFKTERALRAFEQISRLTHEAERLTAPILKLEHAPETAKHMAACFQENTPYVDALLAHMRLRIRLLAHLEGGTDAGIENGLNELILHVDDLARDDAARQLQALDYMGAARGALSYLREFLARDARWMLQCLKARTRFPDEQPDRHEWW